MPERPMMEDRPYNRSMTRKGHVRWRVGNRYGVDAEGGESQTIIATYLGPNVLPLGYTVLCYWHPEVHLWVIHAIPLPANLYNLALVGSGNWFVHKGRNWYTYDLRPSETGDVPRLLRRTKDELFYLDSPNGTLRPQVSINDGQSYDETSLPGDGADSARGLAGRSPANARMFVTFDKGLYSTTDAGASWSQDWAAPAPQVGSLINVHVEYPMVVMSAAADATGADGAYLLVSGDGGATFTEYEVDPTLTDGTNQDMQLVYTPAATIVFAYQKSDGDIGIVYSNDDGATLTEVATFGVAGGYTITDIRAVGDYVYISATDFVTDIIMVSSDSGVTFSAMANTPFGASDVTMAMAYHDSTDQLFFAGQVHNASLANAAAGGTAFQAEDLWDDYSSAMYQAYEPLPTHSD